MTLFGVEEVLPSGNEASLSGDALREQVNEALSALSAVVGEDPPAMQTRVLKMVNRPRPGDCDDHDLREVLREVRVCTQEGAGVYRKRLKRITQVTGLRGSGGSPGLARSKQPRPRAPAACAATATRPVI